MSIATLPEPLPYHVAIRDHLKTHEAGLWRWFLSDDFSGAHVEETKLHLLKSCYRLGRESHDELHEIASSVADALEISHPITLYQAEGAQSESNASLCFFVDEIAIVFSGPITERLTPAEMRAVLGHEMAHHRLYTESEGEYFAATRLLSWSIDQPDCHQAYVETARRFRLHTELYADRVAAFVCGSPDPVIASLVKINTGLETVTVSDYLAQTEEILEKDKAGSRASTHPEVYLRAKALSSANGESGDFVELVRGALDVQLLDLVDQRTLATLTRHLFVAAGRDERFRSDPHSVLACDYFPSFQWTEPGPELPALAHDLADFEDETRRYASHVLLDLATADRDDAHPLLGPSLRLAERLGVFEVYEPIARKELKLKKADTTRAFNAHAGSFAESTHE